MGGTEYFNQIGESDVKWWDGIARTYTRRTSTGGLLTQNKIGSVVDVAAAFGSGTISYAALADAVSKAGSASIGLLLRPGTWDITADLTIPANLTLICPDGVDLAVAATKTLTINGGLEGPKRQIFSGTGTVSIGGGLCEIWAEWFAGADIGAKVNAAIAAANALYPMTIRVLPASWDGQSYATGIVINKVVSLQLPFAEAYPAVFTGATAAVQFSTTYAAHLHNLSVDLTGNANLLVDGLQLLQSGRNRISGKVYIKGAIRDGIRIDSNNVSGSGSNNYFEAECRVVNAAVCGLHLLNGAGGATNTPNSNVFDKFRSSGIGAAGTDIYFEEGYSNFVKHAYLESHGANAWAVHNASGSNAVGPCTIDATCVNGVKQTGGSLAFVGTLNNNATGTKYSGDVYYTTDGGVVGQSLMLHSLLAALPTSLSQPNIFSTAGGAAAPFDEFGNLILMPRADANPRDFIVYTGNPPVERFRISRTGEFTGMPNRLVQVVNYSTGAMSTTATAFPIDDTIPQITEGGEFLSLAITPTDAANKLLIMVVLHGASSAAQPIGMALFQDATVNALCATVIPNSGVNSASCGTMAYYMTAGTAVATTFTVRAGKHDGATFTLNGYGGARLFGGMLISSITIYEISV